MGGEPWADVVECFAIASLDRVHRSFGEHPWFWVVAWPGVIGAAAADFWEEIGTPVTRRAVASAATAAHLELSWSSGLWGTQMWLMLCLRLLCWDCERSDSLRFQHFQQELCPRKHSWRQLSASVSKARRENRRKFGSHLPCRATRSVRKFLCRQLQHPHRHPQHRWPLSSPWRTSKCARHRPVPLCTKRSLWLAQNVED